MSVSDRQPLVLFTGGGTSGHIHPALAITEELARQLPGVRIAFAGSGQGLEAELVPRAGYDFHAIPASPFRRKLSVALLRAVRDFFRGRRRSRALLRELQPSAVVATGGYVSAPVLAAAARAHIPILIHEQNAMPGRSNQLMARHAAAICLGYAEAEPLLRGRQPAIVTGNPVSGVYQGLTREAARRELGLDPERFIVLVTGGSLGARTLNQTALDWLEVTHAREDRRALQLILVSGRALAEETKTRADALDDPRLDLHTYLHDMPLYQAASDLVVCRAGALTCAEIAMLGRVALFVPYPFATGDHQTHNAEVAHRREAAFLVRNAEFTAEALERVITALQEPGRREAMEARARALATPEAREQIVAALLPLIERGQSA